MNFIKKDKLWFVIFLVMLTGCATSADVTVYNQSIEDGLDYFGAEEYSKAEIQFELALEEKENDELAEALLGQTVSYSKALQLIENDDYDGALIHAQTVVDTPNGSASIVSKAEDLINEPKETQGEESIVQATDDDKKEALKTDDEIPAYEYNDFKGYYLHFDSSDRTHADIAVGIGDKHILMAWWRSEGYVYEILEKSIDDNILTVNYYISDSYLETGGEYGTLEITLNKIENEKSIILDPNSETHFYESTYDGVLSYDYTLNDFVNEDISPINFNK